MGEPENKQWTEEERLELAARLDRELDEFIDNLEKRQYTEGWPEDRWQEEMDKHPFFMKKPPEPGDELHPLLEGIQQLKYDPDENTAEDLANNYKEDGNFYTKNKKFRLAIMCYTEGLKSKCVNDELNAILYNNRSAAHFFIKNYRSSLLDAQKALELKPDYTKAKLRAAQSAECLGKYDLCLQYCNELLDEDMDNTKAMDLAKSCKKKKIESERDERKRLLEEKRKTAEFQKLVDEIKKRNVKFDDIRPNKPITEELLKPKILTLENYPVKVEEDNVLSWPVAFSYPEFLFSDFQYELREDVVLEDALNKMFEESLPLDTEKKYRPGNMNVYYENRKAGMVHKADLTKTLRQIMEEKSFYVTGGCLLFYVVAKNSRAEEEYKNEKRRPLFY